MVGLFNELVSVEQVKAGYVSKALCLLCGIFDIEDLMKGGDENEIPERSGDN